MVGTNNGSYSSTPLLRISSPCPYIYTFLLFLAVCRIGWTLRSNEAVLLAENPYEIGKSIGRCCRLYGSCTYCYIIQLLSHLTRQALSLPLFCLYCCWLEEGADSGSSVFPSTRISDKTLIFSTIKKMLKNAR